MTRIRPERPADAPAIRAVIAAAFGGDAEADLVERLRRDGDLVLSLVAEWHVPIVGHIAFSRLLIDGRPDVRAVALAPVAVLPEFQRRGIGTGLIAEAHRRLRDCGEALAIVVGYPDYYTRFGYSRARAVGFESEYQGSEAFMACAFAEAPRTGRVRYPPAFAGL